MRRIPQETYDLQDKDSGKQGRLRVDADHKSLSLLSEFVDYLRQEIIGEVRFDKGSRSLYAVDASNYRQVPIGVVIPYNKLDVIKTVRACHQFGFPVLSRGGGTSLAGQCCNAAVVMDMSKYYSGIIDIDPINRLARVYPGTVLDELRSKAEEFGLTFGPDPSTHTHCTMGGMIGNNSCGIRSIMSGRTANNVHELEVLTYDGEVLRVGATSEQELQEKVKQGGRQGQIYRDLKSLADRYGDLIRRRFPDMPRRVSGYCLEQLLPEQSFQVARALTGSESTCVTILEATVKLIDNPRARVLAVIGFSDVYYAGDAGSLVLESGPIGLEGIDYALFRRTAKELKYQSALKLFPKGKAWLIAEFGGQSIEKAAKKAAKLKSKLRKLNGEPELKIITEPSEQEGIWEVREAALGTTAWAEKETEAWEGWEDAAVPPARVGAYLRDFKNLLDRYEYSTAMYGHFGDGCIHCRINFDLRSAEGVAKYVSFTNDAADIVLKYGGSLSGEHGDGQTRGPLLEKMYGQEIVQAFREFKAIWDPLGKMNPGKVVASYPTDANLRLGPNYIISEPKTAFSYPEDNGSFAHATLRCVGIGKCRRKNQGTMCPSYMATLEEKHSTRGRAHLLHEMLTGDLIKDGFASEEVKEALDLCLACKACKQECPVNIDMATYKAEFFNHYYQIKKRPRQAYTIGLIHWWSKLASQVPELVNIVGHTPGLKKIVKLLGGISQKREIPYFAKSTYRRWYQENIHRLSGRGRPKVMLFPDTFNNHLHPYVARAATEVLDQAGFDILIPPKVLCCGRPLFDFGMIDIVKRLHLETIHTLKPYLDKNIPIVGIEPSCLAVFRDELTNLFPKNPDAQKLKDYAMTFGEFLDKNATNYQPPKLKNRALLHGHCQHKAIMGIESELRILEKLGVELDVLDAGCCGMAGAFGFEPEKYDISISCGERKLLPTVRSAPSNTVVVTDGFSCKEQIEQTTSRQALHLAELLHLSHVQEELDLKSSKPFEDVYYEKYKNLGNGATFTTKAIYLVLSAGTSIGIGMSMAKIWKIFRTR